MINYLICNDKEYVYELGKYFSFDNIIFPNVFNFDILMDRIGHIIKINKIVGFKTAITTDILETIGVDNLIGDTDIITSDQKRPQYGEYILVGTVNDDKSDVGKSISKIYWAKQKMGKDSVEILSPDEIKQKYFTKTELTDEQKRYINNILVSMIKTNDFNLRTISINDIPSYDDYIHQHLRTLVANELKSKGWSVNVKCSYSEIKIQQPYKK